MAVSLEVASIATLIALSLGLAIGLLAGFAGVLLDSLLMRVVDLVLAFPFLLLAILLAALLRDTPLGQGAAPVFITLGVVRWTTMARVVRGKVLSLGDLWNDLFAPLARYLVVCIGRRMSELPGRLVDERLPYAAYRQWTFSFPWRIRVALTQDGRLLSKVLSICKRKVFANQRKHARRLGIEGGQSFTVTMIQRFGSLLQLNVHDHSVIPNGVFADGTDGQLTFELTPPTDADVESIMTTR